MNPYILKTIKGIKTVIYPIEGVETVRVELAFKAGSHYETGKNWGGMHFLEHIVILGTDKFPTKMVAGEFKEKHGLVSNAYTGGTRFGIWTKGPHYSIEQALDLINQQAFHPLIRKSDFARELNVIENEYKTKWDNKYNRFYRALDQQRFGKDHLYIRDGIGQVDYIRTLTLENLKKLYKDHLVAEKAYLVITGKIDMKKIESLVENTLEPQRKKVKELETPPLSPGKKKLVHYEKMEQEEMFVHWPLPGISGLPKKERVGISVVNYILGGGTNSILYGEIRQKRGLAYRVYSRQGYFDKAGYLGVWTNINPKNHNKVLKLIREGVYGFLSKPIDKKRFQKAIDFINSQDYMNYDSVDKISSLLMNQIINEKRIYLPQDYLEISKTLKSESTTNLLRKYINPENEFLAVMKNKDLGSETKAPLRK